METMVVDEPIGSCIHDLRQELDEHLNAINETTDEVEMNFSYLINLEKKMKFLEQKLERIEKALSKVTAIDEEKPNIKKIHIRDAEQDVFMVIYNAPKAIDYKEICRFLRKSETFVRYQINGLINKGVPISRHVINRKTFFSLDPEFKELQTKENVLNLARTLTLDCFDQSIV